MRVTLAWGSDPGLQRTENEDSVLVWKDRAGVAALLVVCDGMGGHAAGQKASSLAVDAFASTLAADGGQGADPERLRAATAEANAAVHEAARLNPEWQGMGSTLVSAAIGSGEMALCNVGDSPAWLFRKSEATLISQEHSWPAEQVRLGIIGPEEAKDHPLKHRLTRAVGVWESIAAYANKVKVHAGDVVVLCSDGVESAGVAIEEMADLLFSDGDLDAGIRRVIQRCRELGAPDNVTLAVARIERIGDTGEELETAKLKVVDPDTAQLPGVKGRKKKPA